MKDTITENDLLRIMNDVGFPPPYPCYIGNGLWRLAENVIAGEKGLRAFERVLADEIKKSEDETIVV